MGARLLGNGATLKGGHLGAGVIRFEGGTFAGSWTVAAGTTLVGANGGLKMFSGDHGVPTDFTNRGTVS